MTLEQLEQRVEKLEKELAELREAFARTAPRRSIDDTFGMFANDPGFDEMIRLGREYRDRVNAEDK